MRAVHKFPIPTLHRFFIEMPRSAYLLHVAPQGGGPDATPQLWASVDIAQKETERRNFMLVATGEPYDATRAIYIGTFIIDDGNLVFHLFELLGP